ncbi:MAG: type II toxin-antitoxin system MqsA family antitoxin [Gemmatimonadetes bacterium]|nr:type II toxin-antitoxin system MqsA family antitoxin [Gemmatimonadota bacterium]NNF15004.1 type II toxin-antitoxin system MqsA family antitoxin [Gemmatimonadota bacterium]
MKDEMFQELVASVREGGAILRGEKQAAKAMTIDAPDVAQIRATYDLSQSQFAALLGISVRTLQNWEQGRRSPQGPAQVLLRVAARHPEAVLDAVR